MDDQKMVPWRMALIQLNAAMERLRKADPEAFTRLPRPPSVRAAARRHLSADDQARRSAERHEAVAGQVQPETWQERERVATRPDIRSASIADLAERNEFRSALYHWLDTGTRAFVHVRVTDGQVQDLMARPPDLDTLPTTAGQPSAGASGGPTASEGAAPSAEAGVRDQPVEGPDPGLVRPMSDERPIHPPSVAPIEGSTPGEDR